MRLRLLVHTGLRHARGSPSGTGCPWSAGPSGRDVPPALLRPPASLDPTSLPSEPTHPQTPSSRAPRASSAAWTGTLCRGHSPPRPPPLSLSPDLGPRSRPRPAVATAAPTAAPAGTAEGVQPQRVGAGARGPRGGCSLQGPLRQPRVQPLCPRPRTAGVPRHRLPAQGQGCRASPTAPPSGPLQMGAQRPKNTTKELQPAVCPLLRNLRGPGLLPILLVASCVRLSTY